MRSYIHVGLLLCINGLFAAHSIILYTDEQHTGRNIFVPNSNCTNLPFDFVETVSSVNTENHCAQLYDQADCTGNHIAIPVRSPFHYNLEFWNFNDKTKSVGVCEDPCIPEGGKSVSDTTNTAPIRINMYSKPKYKGIMYSMDVDGCSPVNFNQPLTFAINVLSIRLEKGKCALVFVGNPSSMPNNCTVDRNYKVYEIRDDIPSLDDFSLWVAQEDPIIAVGACQCKLAKKNWVVNETRVKYHQPQQNNSKAEQGFLTLYSQHNYRGSYLNIPLNFTGCKDLSSREHYEWEGLAESMVLSEGSCVLLHKNHNCSDALSQQFISSVPNLSDHNLDMEIRSIAVCKPSAIEVGFDSTGRNSNLILIIGFPLVCIVVSIFGVILLVRKSTEKYKAIIEMLSDKEIDEFILGLGLDIGSDEKDSLDEGTGNLKFSSELLVQNQPYNTELEISKSLLQIDTTTPLGSGQYGVVYKGSLSRSNIPENYTEVAIPVAIKTTKSSANAQCLRAMMKEIKVMTYVGKHPNMVELIGCCTSGLRQGELFIVMEFCEKGSLERYLKANKDIFVNVVYKGKICIDKVDPELSPSYLPMQNLSSPANYSNTLTSDADRDETTKFDILQLIKWCIGISEGMQYLASKRVIHGDLAARNVLLSTDLTSKISDFGLSRKLYCYSQYTRNAEEPLPWRWLAIESLKNLEFSTESDIWSFGILMWELFTLGEQPYPGVAALTNNFILNLEQGYRPTIPLYATSDCYNLMSSCWNEDKSRRPRFSSIAQNLKEIKEICAQLLSVHNQN